MPSGITAVDIGHSGGFVSFNGIISRVWYTPRRVPNANLADFIA